MDELLAIEAEELTPNNRFFDLLPGIYGVSPSYTVDGATSQREQFAERLARLLRQASTEEHLERRWWPKRLARIKAMIGLPSEDEFRDRLGWLFPSYVASQIDSPSSEWAGSATIDLQVGLCLAMHAMPEYGVLSRLPVLPRAFEAAMWWRPLREENFAFLPLPLESTDWEWLDLGASYREAMSLQIVQYDGQSFCLMEGERLEVPRSSLPAAGAAAGGSLYCLRWEVSGRPLTVVLDPERGEGNCMLVDRRYTIVVGAKRDPHVPSQDPIQLAWLDQPGGSLGKVVTWL